MTVTNRLGESEYAPAYFRQRVILSFPLMTKPFSQGIRVVLKKRQSLLLEKTPNERIWGVGNLCNPTTVPLLPAIESISYDAQNSVAF